MAGLTDREIDLIAQRIVTDLTGRGGNVSAGKSEKPASSIPS